jgi:superoxide dismutase, Fe-Mn family
MAYVNNANLALEKIEVLRKSGDLTSIRPLLLSLSFNASGHFLHSLFWEIMKTPTKDNVPTGKIKKMIDSHFGSFEIFWKEFSATAISIEGSGWSTLVYDTIGKQLLILPIEKHNLLGVQGAIPILALDVWEHAFYLKYLNDKATYVGNFKYLINWEMVEKKLQADQLNLNLV